MKANYHQTSLKSIPVTEELTPFSLAESIEKTRQALEIAYAGFDNALDVDLIDSYIYEINSLSKRYEHLTNLAAKRPPVAEKKLYQHSAIRTLVSHVFGQGISSIGQSGIYRL